ncbi:hypothetical protein QAD02_006102 [Eretmocerus hayati]|uniref:Uncharacterized protein n=1 Tax=Eretmocerus hayati TaxID=131215 RepID=A0ACC2N424_9HYME|nr:hypothetical protein QAD02_006102 [Eretmocerus hayati]
MELRKKPIVYAGDSLITIITLIFLSLTNNIEAQSVSSLDTSITTNAAVIFSGANHYDNYLSFYSVCNRNNRTHTTCKIHARYPGEDSPPFNCSIDLHKSVDRLSDIPMRLTSIRSRVILSWIDISNGRNRYLKIRLIDVHHCKFVEEQFKLDGPIPVYKIVPFRNNFDVFFKSDKGGDNLENQAFTKVTFDVSGNKISEVQSFFAHVPEPDLRLSNSDFCGLSQILPVSYENHEQGYYFISRNLYKISTLDPEGHVKKTVQLDFMLNPKNLAYGYGSISIPRSDGGIKNLIQYNENLDNVHNITYVLGNGKIEERVFAIGENEFVLLTSSDHHSVHGKAVYISKIYADGRQSQRIRIKMDYPRDEFYLTFTYKKICLNGLSLTEYGSHKKLDTVCLDKRYLDQYSNAFNRSLVIRIVNVQNCKFSEHRFDIGGPIPAYNIVTFKNYSDIFFKSEESGNDFTKITVDENGDIVSEMKSFLANIPATSLRIGDGNSYVLSQLLAVSFEDYDKGYYFIVSDLQKISTLDTEGHVKKTLQLDFVFDPKIITSGYGSIAIPRHEEKINELVQYDENLEYVRSITYTLREGVVEENLFAISAEEFVLLSFGNNSKESKKSLYLSTLSTNGRQSQHIQMTMEHSQDELYLTFTDQKICVNGATLTDYGNQKKWNTVCLNKGYLDHFA